MTEIRYIVDWNKGCILDTVTNEEYSLLLQLKEALNEQNETIIQLKQENKELQFAYDECSNNKLFSRRKLETENKHLKDENQQLKDLIIIAGYTIKNNNGEITLELKQ